MNVLIICETSGVMREAFRAHGDHAMSLDLLPAEDDSEHHYQVTEDFADILSIVENNHWDLVIAHPPCKYLSNSGVWALHRDEDRWAKMEDGREFFMRLYQLPVQRLCIENPVPHKYGNLPKYSQIIQPYQFGDDASKRTCLWLKNLPLVQPLPNNEWAQPRIVDGKPRWSNQTDAGQNRVPPSENRWQIRSRTYPGIAKALSDQFR